MVVNYLNLVERNYTDPVLLDIVKQVRILLYRRPVIFSSVCLSEFVKLCRQNDDSKILKDDMGFIALKLNTYFVSRT